MTEGEEEIFLPSARDGGGRTLKSRRSVRLPASACARHSGLPVCVQRPMNCADQSQCGHEMGGTRLSRPFSPMAQILVSREAGGRAMDPRRLGEWRWSEDPRRSGNSLAQLDQRGQREPHPSGCDCKLLNSLTDFNGIRVLSRLGRPTRSSRAPHRYDSDARAFTRALYRGATPMKVGNGEWGTGNVASYQCCQLSIWVKEKMQVKSGFYHRDSEARSPIGDW